MIKQHVSIYLSTGPLEPYTSKCVCVFSKLVIEAFFTRPLHPIPAFLCHRQITPILMTTPESAVDQQGRQRPSCLKYALYISRASNLSMMNKVFMTWAHGYKMTNGDINLPIVSSP